MNFIFFAFNIGIGLEKMSLIIAIGRFDWIVRDELFYWTGSSSILFLSGDDAATWLNSLFLIT